MSLVFASTRQTANPEKQPSIRATGGRKSKKQEIPHDDQKHQQQQQRIFTCSVLGNKLFACWNRVLGAVTPLATLIWVKDSNTVLRPAAVGGGGGGGGGGSNVMLPAGLSLQRQPKRLAHATLNLDDMRVVKNAVGGVSNTISNKLSLFFTLSRELTLCLYIILEKSSNSPCLCASFHPRSPLFLVSAK
jgi:hypothetical protein